MSELNSDRSKPWNMYTSSDPATPSESEAPWKSFGTSMSAISFGFVATAILISMFLIMAIFEHLFRPNPPFSQDLNRESPQSGHLRKLGSPQTVGVTYASDFSVVMPGQQYPTYIAQPAPLPCSREGIYRPPHEHSLRIFP